MTAYLRVWHEQQIKLMGKSRAINLYTVWYLELTTAAIRNENYSQFHANEKVLGKN